MVDKNKELNSTKIDWMRVDDVAFELYSKLYFSSLDIREKMAARAQLPLAVTLALIGAQSYLVENELFDKRGWELAAYALLLLVSFGFLCSSSHLFSKVMSGQTYKVLPDPLEIEQYRLTCLSSYSEHLEQAEWHDQWAATAIRGEIARNLVECATENGRMNDRRSEYSWLGHRRLSIAVVLTAVAFVGGHGLDFFAAWNRDQKTLSAPGAKAVLVGSIGAVDLEPFFPVLPWETDKNEQPDE